jgi:uncharacterized protein YbaR (Trm112 family)
MSSEPGSPIQEFDIGLLKQLACPVCFGALQIDSQPRRITCIECRRAYPLIDGIPVLIPDRVL